MGKDKIMEHNTRVEQIKTYLKRLSAGEELEKVRTDFVKEFEEVDPTFTRENEVLENVIRECRNEIEETNTISPELFGKLREVAIHYAKKGDLLYPHLKVKYGISGPSDVMWTTDDEIRDELAALAKDMRQNENWIERFVAALQRVEDMIYKDFLPELCPEFHGGRVVWNLSRFERLSGLLWCGKCDMGGGREISAYRKLQ